MRSIYIALVRHAPTAWNLEGRAQGRADIPLSPEGEARARTWRLPTDLGTLDGRDGLGWAASPLRRASDTAARLGARRLAIEPRLAERDYGRWTGRPLVDLDSSDRGWDAAPPDGETSASVLGRVREWLDEVAAGEGPDTWVAVSHQGVIRVLVAAAVRWDLVSPAPLRLLPDRLHRIRRRGDGLLQLMTLNEPLLPAP